MSNNFATIKERILQVLEYKGIVKDKFFSDIGMTYGNFTGNAKKTTLNSTAIGNIFAKIPDINLEWLLTGKGEMLRSSDSASIRIDHNFAGGDIVGRQIGSGVQKIKKDAQSEIISLRQQLRGKDETIASLKELLAAKDKIIALLEGK